MIRPFAAANVTSESSPSSMPILVGSKKQNKNIVTAITSLTAALIQTSLIGFKGIKQTSIQDNTKQDNMKPIASKDEEAYE